MLKVIDYGVQGFGEKLLGGFSKANQSHNNGGNSWNSWLSLYEDPPPPPAQPSPAPLGPPSERRCAESRFWGSYGRIAATLHISPDIMTSAYCWWRQLCDDGKAEAARVDQAAWLVGGGWFSPDHPRHVLEPPFLCLPSIKHLHGFSGECKQRQMCSAPMCRGEERRPTRRCLCTSLRPRLCFKVKSPALWSHDRFLCPWQLRSRPVGFCRGLS